MQSALSAGDCFDCLYFSQGAAQGAVQPVRIVPWKRSKTKRFHRQNAVALLGSDYRIFPTDGDVTSMCVASLGQISIGLSWPMKSRYKLFNRFSKIIQIISRTFSVA